MSVSCSLNQVLLTNINSVVSINDKETLISGFCPSVILCGNAQTAHTEQYISLGKNPIQVDNIA